MLGVADLFEDDRFRHGGRASVGNHPCTHAVGGFVHLREGGAPEVMVEQRGRKGIPCADSVNRPHTKAGMLVEATGSDKKASLIATSDAHQAGAGGLEKPFCGITQ